jgi:hypothetical protein
MGPINLRVGFESGGLNATVLAILRIFFHSSNLKTIAIIHSFLSVAYSFFEPVILSPILLNLSIVFFYMTLSFFFLNVVAVQVRGAGTHFKRYCAQISELYRTFRFSLVFVGTGTYVLYNRYILNCDTSKNSKNANISQKEWNFM